MTIGEKIKTVRELKNFTQDFMAEQLKITQTAYSKLERDENKITYDKLEKIADILDMKLTDLIDFDDKQVLFSISQKQMSFSDGSPNNLNFNMQEKKYYQEKVQHLEQEVLHLKKIVSLLEEQIRAN